MSINHYAAAAVSAVAAAALSLLLSNKTVSVSRFELAYEQLPPQMGELKILHLSDLHKKSFGRNYEKLFRKIPDEKYDMVCFTGDMMSRTENSFGGKEIFVRRLAQIAPVYFVGGNHEADNEKGYQKLRKMLIDCSVSVLDNRRVEFNKNGASITISGLFLDKSFYRNADGGFSRLVYPDLPLVTSLLGQKPQSFEIMLAHNPLYAGVYREYGAELVLCGHIHGGAVRLPFVGGLLSPERRFFPEYSAGLYRLSGDGKVNMIVSKGLGKLRLFNPPEITVVIIKAADKAEQKNARRRKRHDGIRRA